MLKSTHLGFKTRHINRTPLILYNCCVYVCLFSSLLPATVSIMFHIHNKCALKHTICVHLSSGVPITLGMACFLKQHKTKQQNKKANSQHQLLSLHPIPNRQLALPSLPCLKQLPITNHRLKTSLFNPVLVKKNTSFSSPLSLHPLCICMMHNPHKMMSPPHSQTRRTHLLKEHTEQLINVARVPNQDVPCTPPQPLW